MTVEPIENGDGDPTKEEEAPKKANGILLVIATESPKATPIPHRGGGVISPRTRPWSESSEVEPQSNGNPHFDLGSSYLELDDNNLSLLPENDYQSTYSINNDFPGYQIRGEAIVDQLPVPPDGGYGWVIVGAAFVCNFIVDGTSNAFGPFMASYQQTFGASKAAVSLIGSLLIGTYLLSGPIAGGLLNNYEARNVVVAGTVLSSIAFVLSTFSPNIFFHYFLYGILGGVGFGFIYLPAIVVVSQYFESKRALATGISVAGSGFGTFVMPQLAKFLIETFGWRVALYAIAALILLCAFCGLLFRPLKMPEIDAEQNIKLSEEMKQQALLAALSRADGEELESNLSEGADTMTGAISPVKRSATTRSSREDGLPLLLNGIETATNGGPESPSASREENAAAAEDLAVPPSPMTPHRPPLSPIPESGGIRRLSKSRAGSQYQPPHGAAGDGLQGRHPTMVSTNRTRKPTLASMASDLMGSSNQLRLSRANLSGQLSRVSARSYAQSLCRISQAPTQSIKGGESVLSVAALSSIIEPKEFARPLSRHDIFLQGSIRNLKEFESEGGNFHRYRESQISIPMMLAAQNAQTLSSSLSHAGGNMVESSHRFGGSQYSRITDVFGVGECDELNKMASTKFPWIPFPIRQAFCELISLSLLAEPVLLLLCISNVLAMLGFYVPFVFLIDLAVASGASLSEATMLLSLIGIANTFGRVFFGWLADQRWVSALAITNWSLISCGLLTIFCPLVPGYSMLMAYAGLFGFIVAAYVCLTSILLSDLLGIERLTNSFGILVVARGIASLLGTPIAGIVFDITQSYNAAFYFSGILILLAGLVSTLVSFVHRYQRSQLRNEGEYVEPQKTQLAADQIDAQSGKLSVLTERSEENLTEYQRTIASLHQQRALLQELEQYKHRNEVVDEESEEAETEKYQQHDELEKSEKPAAAAQDAD